MRELNFKGIQLLVSECGVILNKKNMKPYKHVKDNNGYLRVYVTIAQNKRAGLSVHRAVALTYIENPKSLSDVNHIDGNKSNNNLSNLEWLSHKDNIKHALKTGLFKEGRISMRKTLRNKAMRDLRDIGYSQFDLSVVFECSQPNISERLKDYALDKWENENSEEGA